MDETVDAGLFVEGRYYLDLLIIHDYDALRAVLLYHLLIIGCWSVIAGFLYRSLLTDHGRRMTVSLFVLFWVRGRSRDLVAAGEEGARAVGVRWGHGKLLYTALLCCYCDRLCILDSAHPIFYISTRHSSISRCIYPLQHTADPAFCNPLSSYIIRTRETQPLKLAPCATTFLLFQAAFSSLFLHFCIHPSLSFFHSIPSSPPSSPHLHPTAFPSTRARPRPITCPRRRLSFCLQ